MRKSRGTEADLLEHLGEIEERRLYLGGPHPTMFIFCISDYGFSEDVAYQRITVARAARRLPAILDALRSGRVHLTGLRLLAPHVTAENVSAVLSEATGKSTRQIEELVARLAPKPPVPTVIRKMPAQANPEQPPPSLFEHAGTAMSPGTAVSQVSSPATESVPVSAPRHRVPDGDVGTIVEKALEVLIERVTKQRFAQVRKPRKATAEVEPLTGSRHIPSAIQREVFERDGGRCLMIDHICADAALRARLFQA